MVAEPQIRIESKAQLDEKAEHIQRYVSILKKCATPLSGIRWGYETTYKQNHEEDEGGNQMTEYEIIADPKEYGIEKLVDGLNGNPIDFPPEERVQWASEVGAFAERLNDLSGRAKSLQNWLAGEAAIKATPSSLKTLKIQLFKINDALDTSIGLVHKLEGDIVPGITKKH
jgi:hypothetical protein